MIKNKTYSGEVEIQSIACTKCGAADRVKSDDERAIKWPAWTPGPLFEFCPACRGTCWATDPIPARIVLDEHGKARP